MKMDITKLDSWEMAVRLGRKYMKLSQAVFSFSIRGAEESYSISSDFVEW
jgi:hypothetical protein